ncbi:MAG TPA: hypothetical protein VH593_25080, partial [Ktedonobacteraceae bacterium]
TPIDPSGTASCSMGINIEADAGHLTATPPADVTLVSGTQASGGATNGTITSGSGTTGSPYHYTLNGHAQEFDLSFTMPLTDARGGTTGWNLEANVSSLPTGATVTLTSLTGSTCPTSDCFPAVGSLSHATFPLALSGSDQEYVGAPDATGSDINAGTYSLETNGTLTLPNNVAASTPINGALTLTINGTAF